MNELRGFVVTAAGRSLFAKLAATESALTFSRIMFGTGKLSDNTTKEDLLYYTELLEPIGEGSCQEPVYKDDIVSLVLQFSSDMNGGLTETVWIDEYGVYANDPDGGEVLIIYGTLGDCPDSVLAYKNGHNTIRQYTLDIIIGSVTDVQTAFPPSAYLTTADVNRIMEDCLRQAVGMKVVSFTVPVESWAQTGSGRYPFQAIVSISEIKASDNPDASLDDASQETAYNCGVSLTITALDGGLQFSAQVKPDAPISGTCRLWTEGVNGNNGGLLSLPIATKTTPGCIMASDSLQVDPDGTAHAVAEISDASFASNAEVEATLNEVYGQQP